MGGAAELPDRASSPLKRRASNMDPEADLDAKDDVDMVAAPLSPPTTTTTSMITEVTDTASASQEVNGVSNASQDETMVDRPNSSPEEPAASLPPSTTSVLQRPASLEAHFKTIKAFVDEMKGSRYEEDQVGFLVSKQWLSKVLPDGPSSKNVLDDLSLAGPVDNSDVIHEILRDPCVGDGVVDEAQKYFVRLHEGVDLERVEIFPQDAWDLLMKWPGLMEDQRPIVRRAHDFSGSETLGNASFELHPVVMDVHRLWSPNSPIAIDQRLKATNPPPPRLARSRSFPYQKLLAQAKRVCNINLDHRVQVWKVLKKPSFPNGSAPTPPDSPGQDNKSTGPDRPFDHLLVNVDPFTALELNSEREKVDMTDHTNNSKYNGHATLSTLGLTTDLGLVLDEQIESFDYVSTYSPSRASASLPTRNSSASLTVQNRNSRSGRTSPAPSGPITRGRTQKSGRVLGCVGLSNLGNTCYMNAALQCVKSVEELTKYFLSKEWKRELNKDNVLAHNGDVAANYAHLLEEIFRDPAPSSVTPRQFKNVIGRYAPSFSGYGQQDSQEFVGFLLDGLQEDLSRIKKKPYIEKPDSTDEMVNDPDAIRKMAEQVWDITKKRDDSVIADLFTGLYKSTLVCPECGKISITFDPFNNLTLPLPVENKWNHTVKFFPLHDRPVNIRVELDKHASIKVLKEFLSDRTGIPVERIFGAEEFRNKFYKIYTDSSIASEEITANDNPYFYELEAKPTNWGAKPQKQQKLSYPVRSLLDDEHSAPVPWDDEQAERLVVPVIQRGPPAPKPTYNSRAHPPFFIVVTPEEARSEDIIRRKLLERIATFSKSTVFEGEPDASDTTDTEVIGGNGSDFGSSSDGKVVTRSIQGEDDLVDVHMKDAGPAKNGVSAEGSSQSHPARKLFNGTRPAWVNIKNFLSPRLQNMFDICYWTEGGAWLPTGQNSIPDDRVFPKLSSRLPPETASSEDQLDNGTNGTASNEETSSDEASRPSSDVPQTRMIDESDEEDSSPVVKSPPLSHRQKATKARPGAKVGGSRKKMKSHKVYSKAGNKKLRQQQRQAQKDKHKSFEADGFDKEEPVADGGPLIRLKEGLILDWAPGAYEGVYPNNETFVVCEELPDPELDKIQQTRSRRRKNGITIEACLDEFERKEVLSEQDMWYCPRCKEHRRATKKFDLWKTPDILVVHLKRFMSNAWRREKIDVLVDFPLENLDITSRVLHKEDGKQEVYDLIGVDCHWGGLAGGHYTAHAKNFIDGQWYSYNDSIVSKVQGDKVSDKIVDSSAYLLFYRRRSDVALGGPRFQEILDRFLDDSSDNESGEGQRLGEASSLIGSSSAYLGAGATHQDVGPGGSKTANGFGPNRIGDSMPVGTPFLANSGNGNKGKGVHQSIEDEGVDMGDNPSLQPSGFHGNTWNFQNLSSTTDFGVGSVRSNASDFASDEAQHDSSGDERARSHTMEYEPDGDSGVPGTSAYQLPGPSPEPGLEPPMYDEPTEPQVKYLGIPGGQASSWDKSQKVYEVPATQADDERKSEEAAEIHLDDSDKIKLS